MENLKMQALMELFASGETDVEVEQSFGDYEFTISNQPGEYMVLTEDEREEKACDCITDSVWAFRSSFLADMTNIPQTVFDRLAELCGDANDSVLAIIEATCGTNEFVESAIEADGYGHFLSSYDGKEEEIELRGVWFYVYRIN